MTGKKRIVLYRALGVTILALFALTHSLARVGMSGNETSRFATIQAVLEQNTFAIENTVFGTVDKVRKRSGRDGHTYSDKPPFPAFVVGVCLKPVRAVTKWNFREHREKLVYLVDLVVGGIVNILLFWWLFNLFRRVRRGSVEAKFLLALGSVMGSWLLSYSVVLNNHTPAALCVLGLYVALWKFSRRPTFRAAALAGLACGILGALEIPGGVIFGLALVPALIFAAPPEKRVDRVLAAACVVAFAALCVFILNYVAYRNPLPLYLGQGGSFRPGTHSKSYVGYAVECLFTCRGIFSYQPFLLLAFPALWFRRKGLRAAEWVTVAATLVFTLFYLLLTNEYGGWAYGFRYLIPVIPVWSYLAGSWILTVPDRTKRVCLGALAAVLILWGLVTSFVGAYFPFCCSFEGFRTPPRHFARSVRSSFGGNLLCWSYEHCSESALTRALIRHYGEKAALEHLFWSFVNMRYLDMREVEKHYADRIGEKGMDAFWKAYHGDRPKPEPRVLTSLMFAEWYYPKRMTDDELRRWIEYGLKKR